MLAVVVGGRASTADALTSFLKACQSFLMKVPSLYSFSLGKLFRARTHLVGKSLYESGLAKARSGIISVFQQPEVNEQSSSGS